MARISLIFFLGIHAVSATAAAQKDYDFENRDWNGASDLHELARQTTHTVIGNRFDLGVLQPVDSLLILYPRNDLPLRSLAAFMRDGGRIALADDFGEGSQLLGVYGIRRTATPRSQALQLRGNDQLLLAQPSSQHALSDGVTALVTNHPAALRHQELAPVFAFEPDHRALVLAGAVGEGRLVAISDPSILINNMLEFRGNRRFADNLLRYLGEADGTLYLIGPETELVGSYGESDEDAPFRELTGWLEELSSADLPPAILQLLAAALGLLLLVVSVSTLPRRSPYDGKAMFARDASAGGFIGRVRFFLRRPNDLLPPLMVYKYELEAELVRRLQLGERSLLRDVLEGLRRRGLDDAAIQDARSLLLALDELREKQDHPPAPPKVGAARFAEFVARGERTLALLDDPSMSPRASETAR